jgi:hypothetical protein
MPIDTEIEKYFQAISLILVFVTIFFSLVYSKIEKNRNNDIPPLNQIKERQKQKDLLAKDLAIYCFPLVLLNGFSFYLMSPLAIKIVSISKFMVWDFDFMRTAYILITLLIGAYFLGSLSLLVKHIKAIRKIS